MDRMDPTPDILVVLGPREAAALAWIIVGFLRRVPRPLNGIQSRLDGLASYLRDATPESSRLPHGADLPGERSA
jgi:hypothetical protein